MVCPARISPNITRPLCCLRLASEDHTDADFCRLRTAEESHVMDTPMGQEKCKATHQAAQESERYLPIEATALETSAKGGVPEGLLSSSGCVAWNSATIPNVFTQ